MTDQVLLVIGCGITFIAAAGAYVALRSGFAYGGMEVPDEKSQRPATTPATADAR